jgi:hypothetical protein
VRIILSRGGIAFDVSERELERTKYKTPYPVDPDRASMPGGAIVVPQRCHKK